MSFTQQQQQLKEEFMRVRGTWSKAWESILRLDTGFSRVVSEIFRCAMEEESPRQ
jgi:hypothetical protein